MAIDCSGPFWRSQPHLQSTLLEKPQPLSIGEPAAPPPTGAASLQRPLLKEPGPLPIVQPEVALTGGGG